MRTKVIELESGHIVLVALSKRNVLSLLAKIEGEPPNSARTLERTEDDGTSLVLTVEADADHYGDRTPGRMHPDTETYIRDKSEPPHLSENHLHS